MATDAESRREYSKRYREQNREKIRADKARRYQENRDAAIAASRENYRANRDARLAQKREYEQRNKDKIRAYNHTRGSRRAHYLFMRHGLRPDRWAALWDAQDRRCYLCGEALDSDARICVDHDHSHCGPRKSCGICQRGLACVDCNIAIGHARDDPARLRRMADALEAAQLAVAERMAAVPRQLAFGQAEETA